MMKKEWKKVRRKWLRKKVLLMILLMIWESWFFLSGRMVYLFWRCWKCDKRYSRLFMLFEWLVVVEVWVFCYLVIIFGGINFRVSVFLGFFKIIGFEMLGWVNCCLRLLSWRFFFVSFEFKELRGVDCYFWLVGVLICLCYVFNNVKMVGLLFRKLMV